MRIYANCAALGPTDHREEQTIISFYGPRGGKAATIGVERALAMALGRQLHPAADQLLFAAQDMLRAFGGDVPRWLESEADELARAILEYGDVTPAFRVRIATGDYDAPWAVQQNAGGEWSTLADYGTKEHARAAMQAARAGEELPKEGML